MKKKRRFILIEGNGRLVGGCMKDVSVVHIIDEDKLKEFAKNESVEEDEIRIFELGDELEIEVIRTLEIRDKKKTLVSCDYSGS